MRLHVSWLAPVSSRKKRIETRLLLIYGALPLAYVISGRLGLLLAVPPGYATAVFLPAGIAVAAMFMAGWATLPGTFLGSFVLNVWIGYVLAGHFYLTALVAALGIAFASLMQAAVGGAVLRKVIGYPAQFDNSRELSLFLLLSPIFCLLSATISNVVLWALGVVQLADLMTNWTTWWAGDALGVLVALPLMLILAGEPRAQWRSRTGYVAIPMVLCFALFVAVFVRVSKWENEQSLLQFRILSQLVADKIKATLEEHALFLKQLSNTMTSLNHAVTGKDFHALAQTLLERSPSIQAVEWAPRILPSERRLFEDTRRLEIPGFLIRERDTSGQLRAAQTRSQFYPVSYLEPLDGNEEAVGFDLASEGVRAAAVETAVATRSAVATAPNHLVHEHAQQADILVTYAVPDGPTGPGIVLVVIRMGTFTAALAESELPSLNLRFTDAASPIPLFDSFPPTAGILYETSFNFGTRQYVVQTTPTAAYIALHRGWQSWGVLAAGALSTGLLGGLLLLGTGHTFRLQRLADQLRESEARWRSIFETSTLAIATFDHDLHYVATNLAFRAMLGYTDDELRQLTPLDITVEEERDTTQKRLADLRERKIDHYTVEKQYRRKDGKIIWAQASMARVSQSEPEMFIATIIDVTETKQAQENLRAMQSELARVAQLTTIGQMTASIAHEIRQPLASIIASCNASLRWLAMKPPNLERVRACIDLIAAGGHRTSQVIDSIRAMFEKGKQEKELLNVNQLIREVLELVRGEAQRKRVIVRSNLTDEIRPALANRIQLQQVMLNLFTNAIEAMESVTDGQRLLQVTSTLHPTDGVVIAVEDSGSGMDPRNVDRIFDPFFTTKPHGMGMGLSICRSIVEAHNGRLFARSTADRGSVFEIVLPAGDTRPVVVRQPEPQCENS
jgi:PAS domain S-box-containing protein